MRFRVLAALSVALGACSSGPAGTTRLTLDEPYWERVNVQLVITRNGDCDKRGPGVVSEQELVMVKGQSQLFDVPDDAMACWRHDRNPNSPAKGDWSNWTHANLVPGEPFETEL